VVIISSTIQALSTTGSPVFNILGGRFIYQFNSSGSISF
jgi:hypothetical protein